MTEITKNKVEAIAERNRLVESRVFGALQIAAIALVAFFFNSLMDSSKESGKKMGEAVKELHEKLADIKAQNHELKINTEAFAKFKEESKNDSKDIGSRVVALEKGKERNDEVLRRHETMINDNRKQIERKLK